MFTPIFEELGLSKNESKIYQTLLREGELPVGQLAVKSKVHRRNVYDSLQRLLEKGLVYEILQRSENKYQALEPNKLRELIQEKEQRLAAVMPQLESLYRSTPRNEAVFLYRGIEGWKNYLRDILRVGEDFYCIGAKGGWMDERVMNMFPQFLKEAARKKIGYYHLFDHEVKESQHDIVKYVGKNYKFFPKGFSAPASVDIFGDHVNIITDIHLGGVEEDMSFTVIVNQRAADAFRIWFRFMWDFCPEN